MKSQQEYISILKNNAPKLESDFGITFMRLFGSVALNKHDEGSDVDLFVKMPPSFYNAIAAAQFLEELLGCKVDLICDHKNLSPFFRKQIEENGIDIFTAA
ncbi:MAG: nucleotidyltransferase domain-containing protein [Bacteroidales bacterium]|nr:nucleotidyltransferase domain-containing protein [Bacteroidales bacterium]